MSREGPETKLCTVVECVRDELAWGEDRMGDLLAQLENITGPGGVLTGHDVHSRASGIWRSDGIKASAIVRPRNTKQVSDIFRICNELGQSVLPHG